MSRPFARSALLLSLTTVAALAGCAQLRSGAGDTSAAGAPAPAPAAGETASDTDQTAIADVAAAGIAPVSGGVLGQQTVALGSPTDPGLWVKTALVSADTPGTVRSGSGDPVAVTLRPLDGEGGAQASLSALQALGLPLAGLHPVTLARAG